MNLYLDWKLEYQNERAEFVSKYISDTQAIGTLTAENLEMLSKYILWGKDPETNLNGRQQGFDLKTSSGTWDTSQPESLDALLESPTFSESSLTKTSYKKPHNCFPREVARKNAGPLLPELESLWRKIDETELTINFYDLDHGRRKSPIRPSLLSRFSEEQVQLIHEKSTHLSLYSYLKLRHLLVDLYRQQYIYKDSYSPSLIPQNNCALTPPIEDSPLFWETDICIEPLGLYNPNSTLSSILFQKNQFPSPAQLNQEELQQELTELLWKKNTSTLTFSFTNLDHITILNDSYQDLQDYFESQKFYESNLDMLLKTFDFYVQLTNLKPFQYDILILRRQHKGNEFIGRHLKEKYNHSYSTNYISTLYHQTIMGAIADTARKHREVCENLFWEENFKTCIDCGKTLLKNTDNFMRKQKVKDGFDCRCKVCAKILREKRK